jgi:hypothetical protein
MEAPSTEFVIYLIYYWCLWKTALYVEWVWMNHPVNAYIHALVKNMYLEVLKASGASKIIQHRQIFYLCIPKKDLAKLLF